MERERDELDSPSNDMDYAERLQLEQRKRVLMRQLQEYDKRGVPGKGLARDRHSFKNLVVKKEVGRMDVCICRLGAFYRCCLASYCFLNTLKYKALPLPHM